MVLNKKVFHPATSFSLIVEGQDSARATDYKCIIVGYCYHSRVSIVEVCPSSSCNFNQSYSYHEEEVAIAHVRHRPTLAPSFGNFNLVSRSRGLDPQLSVLNHDDVSDIPNLISSHNSSAPISDEWEKLLVGIETFCLILF